jgi:YcxB-like protein
MKETFIINQELKLKEVLSAFYYLIPRMRLIKKIFLFSFIAGMMTSIVEFSSHTKNSTIWYIFIFRLLFLPSFLALFFFVFIFLAAVLMMKLKPDHFRNVTYRFTHWGMEKTGKGINLTKPWSEFIKFRETKNFILLYITNDDAHIIQKKMLNSNEELESFKQFISQHIKIS